MLAGGVRLTNHIISGIANSVGEFTVIRALLYFISCRLGGDFLHSLGNRPLLMRRVLTDRSGVTLVGAESSPAPKTLWTAQARNISPNFAEIFGCEVGLSGKNRAIDERDFHFRAATGAFHQRGEFDQFEW
jgi:hypothetical protein